MDTPPLPSASARIGAPPRANPASRRTGGAALLALAKPRLAAISVLTTLVAYATARPGHRPGELLLLLAGTAAAAAGALSFNQWFEREADARMRRTRGRPLPAGEVAPGPALAFSVLCSTAGVGLLALGVNSGTAVLAALTIGLYGFLYTPLKRRTRWATEVGAISGALPALMGNAAAGEPGAAPGVVLALVLWCWQMPHFFALGWRHRADYQAAGFPLLPAIDPTGRRTAAWSLGYTAILLAVSLAPCAGGWLGPIYGVGAGAAGGFFLHRARAFLTAEPDRDAAAARLFSASLLYLPLIMTALVIDRFGPW